MQNGKKIEGNTTYDDAFSDAAIRGENDNENKCENDTAHTADVSHQKDFTAQVLERHERLVNKIKNRKY